MPFLRVNFGEATLASGITALSSSITVQAGHNLPTAAGTFRLDIWDGSTYTSPTDDPNNEVVTATYSGTANVYNITRAQESTTAHSHTMGNKASMFYTAGISQDDLTWLGSLQVDETGVSTGKFIQYNGSKLVYVPISSTATGITFTPSSGVISLTSGYSIPTTTSESNWDSAYSASHGRQHGIASTSDHTSSAVTGYLLKADANGLPITATNTDSDVTSAVSASPAKQHSITSTSYHTSSATSGYL
jgi:hypothetical protein